MKIKISDFLTADWLGEEVNKSNPASAVIKDVKFIEADELPFESKKGKYELTLEVNGEETAWLPNKTSLKNLSRAFGAEGDDWIDKSIKLWTTEQLVQGVAKRILYAEAAD